MKKLNLLAGICIALLLVWSNCIYAEPEMTKIKFINYSDNLVYYNLYWLDSGWAGSQYYGPPCVMGGELDSKETLSTGFPYPKGRFVLMWSTPWSIDNETSKDQRFDFNIDHDNRPTIIMATTEGVLIK